jgi:hypothetical protein
MITCPSFVSGPGTRIVNAGKRYPMDDSPTATRDCASGQWVVESGGELKVLADAGQAVDAVVDGLYNEDGTKLRNNYASNALLDAGGVYAVVKPIGGATLRMIEDGVGGIISDWEATPYVNIIHANQDAAHLAMNAKHFPSGVDFFANIQIDSSSASAEDTGMLLQIVGLDTKYDRRLTSGTLRKVYLVKPIAARVQAGFFQPGS